MIQNSKFKAAYNCRIRLLEASLPGGVCLSQLLSKTMTCGFACISPLLLAGSFNHTHSLPFPGAPRRKPKRRTYMWWCRLELARAYAHCVSSAWGPLLECVFALADLQALPASLTDVDDFGDAQGNPLPPSVFAKRCRDRARYGVRVVHTLMVK